MDEKLDLEFSATDKTAAAFRSLRNNIDAAQSAAATLRGAFGALSGGNLGGVTSLLSALGSARVAGPVAVGAALIGIGTAAVKGHQALSRLGSAAEELGIKASVVDGLGRAIDKVGGEGRRAADALRTLQDQAGDDNSGIVRWLEANDKLGSSAGRVRPVVDLYRDAAELIQNAGSATDRLQIATAAFGAEAAPAMVDAILKGADALERLRTGSSAIDEASNSAREFDRVIQEAKTSTNAWIDEMVDNIKGRALPAVVALYDAVTRGAASRLIGLGSAAQSLFLGQNPNASRTIASPSAIDQFYNAVGFNRTQRPDQASATGSLAGPAAVNRTGEVLELLRLEGQQLTLNLDQRRQAEREEAKIVFARRAGLSASEADRESIRSAVDVLFEKRRAFDDLKRSVDAYNSALSFGGEFLVDAFDNLITKTRTWEDMLKGVVNQLAQASIRATLLGEGPLAGLFGTRSRDGNVGGIIGTVFGSLLGRTAHTGAVIGPAGGTARVVDALAFVGAPRMHQGGIIGPGERPIIAKDGEVIGSPRQLSRQFGGASQTIVVNMDNRGAAPEAVAFLAARVRQLEAELRNMPALIAKTRGNNPAFLRT